MRWTEADKKRVRVVIDHVVSNIEGGQAELARQLKLRSRSVLFNWRARGRIPIDYHEAIVHMAQPGMIVTSPMLHPMARQLSSINNRIGFQQGAAISK